MSDTTIVAPAAAPTADTTQPPPSSSIPSSADAQMSDVTTNDAAPTANATSANTLELPSATTTSDVGRSPTPLADENAPPQSSSTPPVGGASSLAAPTRASGRARSTKAAAGDDESSRKSNRQAEKKEDGGAPASSPTGETPSASPVPQKRSRAKRDAGTTAATGRGARKKVKTEAAKAEEAFAQGEEDGAAIGDGSTEEVAAGDANAQATTEEGGAAQEGGEGEELFCVCRQPYDLKRFMIGCDECDGWFHANCVGLTITLAQKLDNYTCPDCKKKGVSANKEQIEAEEKTAAQAAQGAIAPEEEEELESTEEAPIIIVSEEPKKRGRKGVASGAVDKGTRQRSPSPNASRRTPMQFDGDEPQRKKQGRSASAMGMDDEKRGVAYEEKQKRRRDDRYTSQSRGAPQSTPPARRRDLATGKPPLPASRGAAAPSRTDRRDGLKPQPRRTQAGRIISSPTWRSQGLDDDDDMEDLDLDDGSVGVQETRRGERADRADRDYHAPHHHSHHHSHHSSHHHHHHSSHHSGFSSSSYSRIDWYSYQGEVHSSEDDDDLDGVYLTSEDEEIMNDAHTACDLALESHIAQRDDISMMASKRPGYKRLDVKKLEADLIKEEAAIENGSSGSPRVGASEMSLTIPTDSAAASPSPSISPRNLDGVKQSAADKASSQRRAAIGDALYKRSLIVDARALSRSFDDLGETLLMQAMTLPVPAASLEQAAAHSAIESAAAKVNEMRQKLHQHEVDTQAAEIAATEAAKGEAQKPVDANAVKTEEKTKSEDEKTQDVPVKEQKPDEEKKTAEDTEMKSDNEEKKSTGGVAEISPPTSTADPNLTFQMLSAESLAAHQAYLEVLQDPELITPLPLHKSSSPSLVDHQLVLHMERNKTKVECALLVLEQKRRIYLSGLAYSQRMSALQTVEDPNQDDEDAEEYGQSASEKIDAAMATTSPPPSFSSPYPLTSSLADVPHELPPLSPNSSVNTKSASSDIATILSYKHLLPGLFPSARAGDVDGSENDDIYTATSKVFNSAALSSRISPHGLLPLGRLTDLSLDFLQCPACHGLIPSTGFYVHTSQCSLPSTLSADPNLQRPPVFNQNYPPTYTQIDPVIQQQQLNVTHNLLPLPLQMNLPLYIRSTKRPEYRPQFIPKDNLHTSTASNTQRQQAYAEALHSIDGRLSRMTAAKWDLGQTNGGLDTLTAVCACPLIDPKAPHSILTSPPRFCSRRKVECTEHLLWEDIGYAPPGTGAACDGMVPGKSNMEQQYFILCRRLELLKCELECVYARIHDRAIQHGLQQAPVSVEEQHAAQQAQLQQQLLLQQQQQQHAQAQAQHAAQQQMLMAQLEGGNGMHPDDAAAHEAAEAAHHQHQQALLEQHHHQQALLAQQQQQQMQQQQQQVQYAPQSTQEWMMNQEQQQAAAAQQQHLQHQHNLFFQQQQQQQQAQAQQQQLQQQQQPIALYPANEVLVAQQHPNGGAYPGYYYAAHPHAQQPGFAHAHSPQNVNVYASNVVDPHQQHQQAMMQHHAQQIQIYQQPTTQMTA